MEGKGRIMRELNLALRMPEGVLLASKDRTHSLTGQPYDHRGRSGLLSPPF